MSGLEPRGGSRVHQQGGGAVDSFFNPPTPTTGQRYETELVGEMPRLVPLGRASRGNQVRLRSDR